DLLRSQADAVLHPLEAVVVVAASAGGAVEQAAADAGPIDFTGIFVLELGEAAFAAAVAKRLPFGCAHLFERPGLPERFFHRMDVARPGGEIKVRAVRRRDTVRTGTIWRQSCF